MSPEWTRPAETIIAPTACPMCSGPLEPGRQTACEACTAAARACCDAWRPGDPPIRPSDVLAMRERMA